MYLDLLLEHLQLSIKMFMNRKFLKFYMKGIMRTLLHSLMYYFGHIYKFYHVLNKHW